MLSREEISDKSGIQPKSLVDCCFRDNEQEKRKRAVKTNVIKGNYSALEKFKWLVSHYVQLPTVKTRVKGHQSESWAAVLLPG